MIARQRDLAVTVGDILKGRRRLRISESCFLGTFMVTLIDDMV